MKETTYRDISDKITNDKEMVIIAVTLIAIISIFFLVDPTTIVSSCVSGLFGVVVGRQYK